MKKTLLLAAVLFTAGAACKKGKDDPGAACAAAITQAVSKLPAGNNPAATGVQERLKGVLIARCTEDKWPAEVVTCYEGASSMPTMKACREKLPPELSNKLQAEIQRAMMLGGPMGGAPGGGAPGGGPMGGGGPHMRAPNRPASNDATDGAAAGSAGSAGSAAPAPAPAPAPAQP